MEEDKATQVEVMVSGLGGQGALLFGRTLAEAGMAKYKHVLYFPNYTGLVRGGPTECTVILSHKEVSSPVVFNPRAAIVMSQAALEELEGRVSSGGILFLDSSMVPSKVSREDLKVFYVPATRIAARLGDSQVANLILLGAYLAVAKVVSLEIVERALERKLGGKNDKLLMLDKKALREGAKVVENY